MPRQRIAILGASGFVGSTLCERLYFSQEFEFTPFVHTFGNTSRLTRFPIELAPLDVMSPVRSAPPWKATTSSSISRAAYPCRWSP